jgi:hypothetical protein
MAYDEELANCLREELAGEDAVSEKAMFGGLAFLIHGNMAVSASRHGGLMARVGAEASEDALAHEHTELIVMRGRPMVGWIYVAPEGVKTRRQIGAWVKRARDFARTLPPKR